MVSSHGRIQRNGKIRKQSMTKHGYLYIGLARGGKNYTKSVHSVVARAFLGERPKGMDINHLNLLRNDNRVENLEYCTRLGNITHARLARRKARGVPDPEPYVPVEPKFDLSLAIDVKKAGEILKRTPRRIRQMCESGELVAEKLGRDWLIEAESVDRAKEDRRG